MTTLLRLMSSGVVVSMFAQVRFLSHFHLYTSFIYIYANIAWRAPQQTLRRRRRAYKNWKCHSFILYSLKIQWGGGRAGGRSMANKLLHIQNQTRIIQHTQRAVYVCMFVEMTFVPQTYTRYMYKVQICTRRRREKCLTSSVT